MKRCKTCNVPLFIAFLTISWPWKRRVKSYIEAKDCIDLLPWDWDKNIDWEDENRNTSNKN